jgi:integrase
VASVHERRTSKGERRLFVVWRDHSRHQHWTRVHAATVELLPDERSFGQRAADRLRRRIEDSLERTGTWAPPGADDKTQTEPEPETTLEAHLTDWLDHRASGDAAEHVVGGYRAALKLHVYPTLGPIALSELRRSDVGDLVTDLYKNGKARNTIRNVLSPLCKGLNDAVDRELLTANPAAGIKMPKKAKVREARVPSPDELKKVLAKASPDDDEAPPDAREIITVTASLGLRRGEVFGLKWKDVDLERGLVKIQRQIRAGGEIIEQTKTKAGMRSVPMFASARTVFEARAERLGMPRAWLQNADKWVFPNSIGGPIEPSNWSRREWRPALEAAGVQDLHFHDLRHFAASALRDAGMDNKMRSVVIGHADERITDGVYTHISEEQVAKAAQRFDPLTELESLTLAPGSLSPL